MPADGFEDAVAGTQRSATAQKEEVAESFYESREYPVVPAGVYNAMIVSSVLKESKSERDPPGTTKINLRLEIISDLTGKQIEYMGDDEKPHRFQVFSRPFPKNYGDGKKTGKPSNIYKLIMELTGNPPLTDERDGVKTLDNGKQIKGKFITFNHKMLEFMECQVVVKHNEWQGRVSADIDSYMCTPEQRKKNYDSLPPHPKKGGGGQSPSVPLAPAAAEVFKAAPGARMDEAPATQAVPYQSPVIHKTPQEQQALQNEMASRGFPL